MIQLYPWFNVNFSFVCVYDTKSIMTFQMNAISFPELSFTLVQRNGKTKTNEGSGNEIEMNETLKK